MPYFKVEFERQWIERDSCTRYIEAVDGDEAQALADQMAAEFDNDCPDDAVSSKDGTAEAWSADLIEQVEAEMSECSNCDWLGPTAATCQIKDIFDRVQPGELMPSGECPDCGALCHLCEDEEEADVEEEPCPVNRRPKSTCPDGCTHGV